MKKHNLPRRVSLNTRANGIFHDTLKKNGPRASIEVDRKKIIPRKKKYKTLDQ